MKRTLKHRGNTGKLFNMTNLLAIGVFTVIIGGVFLYNYNEHQQDQIETSYCGDFGFYGKRLTLFKDGEFKFSYHGCSQSGGFVTGNWNKTGDILKLNFAQSDSILNEEYEIQGDKLVSGKKETEDFVFCQNYIDPIERLSD